MKFGLVFCLFETVCCHVKFVEHTFHVLCCHDECVMLNLLEVGRSHLQDVRKDHPMTTVANLLISRISDHPFLVAKVRVKDKCGAPDNGYPQMKMLGNSRP